MVPPCWVLPNGVLAPRDGHSKCPMGSIAPRDGHCLL